MVMILQLMLIVLMLVILLSADDDVDNGRDVDDEVNVDGGYANNP